MTGSKASLACVAGSKLLGDFLHLRDSSVSIVTKLRIGRPRFDSRKGQKYFLFATASRPALEPTQPPIQWVSGALSPGKIVQGVKMIIHLHLVPMLRMHGAINPLTHMASQCGA
jgi:hypothetical protein